MSLYIKAADCGCPECLTDPCGTGCACSFSESRDDIAAGGCVDSQTYDVTGGFLSAHDITIDYDLVGVTLIVKADGTTIWSETSCSNPFSSVTITVPAGTVSLEFIVASCGGACEWSWAAYCA